MTPLEASRRKINERVTWRRPKWGEFRTPDHKVSWWGSKSDTDSPFIFKKSHHLGRRREVEWPQQLAMRESTIKLQSVNPNWRQNSRTGSETDPSSRMDGRRSGGETRKLETASI